MINISVPETEPQLRPRITVFGVGGAGGNAVTNMIKANLEGVEFVIANTDAQALAGSLAEKRIQLGVTVTRGLGAGSRPDVGRAAAEEQLDEIGTHLEGANMVFITAGMGGGTGTGAAPVIARAAREKGILTVGVVTKPFHFEGAHRMRLAEQGIAELQQYVDTLIIIPNQNLFRIANERTTFADAFKMADDVLHSGVRGVTDLMMMPGLINLDFADIRSVMTEMGKAMMGTGEASGERRAIDAAEAAISNPLLDDVSMKGARGVLINITGGLDMTLFEVDEAANRIRDEVDPDANIIFGSTFDESMEGRMRVSVVATGIDAETVAQPRPNATPHTLSVVSGGRKGPAAPIGLTPARTEPRVAETPVAMPSIHAVAPTASGAGAARAIEADPHAYADSDPDALRNQGHAEPVDTYMVAEIEGTHADTAENAPADRQPVGPLRGERRDGQFFAPRPADGGPRSHQTVAPSSFAPPRSAEPPAAERPRKRGPSLFERVTGIGSAARRLMDGGDGEAPRSRPAAPQPQAAAPVSQQQPAQSAPRAPQPAPQPRLSVDSLDRSRMSQAEEDVLDIPAFLRRQAN